MNNSTTTKPGQRHTENADLSIFDALVDIPALTFPAEYKEACLVQDNCGFPFPTGYREDAPPRKETDEYEIELRVRKKLYYDSPLTLEEKNMVSCEC